MATRQISTGSNSFTFSRFAPTVDGRFSRFRFPPLQTVAQQRQSPPSRLSVPPPGETKTQRKWRLIREYNSALLEQPATPAARERLRTIYQVLTQEYGLQDVQRPPGMPTQTRKPQRAAKTKQAPKPTSFIGIGKNLLRTVFQSPQELKEDIQTVARKVEHGAQFVAGKVQHGAQAVGKGISDYYTWNEQDQAKVNQDNVLTNVERRFVRDWNKLTPAQQQVRRRSMNDYFDAARERTKAEYHEDIANIGMGAEEGTARAFTAGLWQPDWGGNKTVAGVTETAVSIPLMLASGGAMSTVGRGMRAAARLGEGALAVNNGRVYALGVNAALRLPALGKAAVIVGKVAEKLGAARPIAENLLWNAGLGATHTTGRRLEGDDTATVANYLQQQRESFIPLVLSGGVAGRTNAELSRALPRLSPTARTVTTMTAGGLSAGAGDVIVQGGVNPETLPLNIAIGLVGGHLAPSGGGAKVRAGKPRRATTVTGRMPPVTAGELVLAGPYGQKRLGTVEHTAKYNGKDYVVVTHPDTGHPATYPRALVTTSRAKPKTPIITPATVKKLSLPPLDPLPSNMSVEQTQQWIKKNIVNNVSLKGMQPNATNEVAQALYHLAHERGLLLPLRSLTYSPGSGRVLAETQQQHVTLLGDTADAAALRQRLAKDRENWPKRIIARQAMEQSYRNDLEAAIAESIWAGRNPETNPRVKALRQRMEDFAIPPADREQVSENLRHVMMHEVGGHVGNQAMPLGFGDDVLGRTALTNDILMPKAKQQARVISDYAMTNAQEYYAEAVNAYLKGEYQRLTPEMIRLIETMFSRLRREQ